MSDKEFFCPELEALKRQRNELSEKLRVSLVDIAEYSRLLKEKEGKHLSIDLDTGKVAVNE